MFFIIIIVCLLSTEEKQHEVLYQVSQRGTKIVESLFFIPIISKCDRYTIFKEKTFIGISYKTETKLWRKLINYFYSRA